MKGVIMQNFFKILFFISLYFFPVNLGFTQDNIEEKENMVEVRQTAMQAMWLRLDRLSTLIAQPGDIVTSSDGSAIVIGSENKTEPREYYTLIHGKDPSQDAQEIIICYLKLKIFGLIILVFTMWVMEMQNNWYGLSRKLLKVLY